MKILLLLFLGVVLFSGCASAPQNSNRRSDGAYPYYVEVETDEPGAKIIVDGEYVGTTPCTITVWGDGNRKFVGSGLVTVNAVPVKAGQFQQTRFYRVPGYSGKGDFIPQKMYFSMSLGPATSTLDVNLYNQ